MREFCSRFIENFIIITGSLKKMFGKNTETNERGRTSCIPSLTTLSAVGTKRQKVKELVST